MLKILLFGEDFAYDIQALCKAFYGEQQIILETIKRIDISFKRTVNELKKGSYLSDINADIKLGVVLDDTELYILAEHNEKRKDVVVGANDGLLYHDRIQYKNLLKRALYQVLSEMTGKKLPWGTLTGVRPSKLILEKLENKESEDSIASFMKQYYLCSDNKVMQGMQIAKRELEILEKVQYKDGYSIYIGIPFCPSKCLYCSFPSYPVNQFGHYMDSYLEALFQEINYVSKCLNRNLTTLYVGGGTPTALNEVQLEKLMIKIQEAFPVSRIKEFTVEAGRPDSITRKKLEILKHYGVTRISINPQTMNQDTLKKIGRKHSVKEVMQTFQFARELGHENINMDLITGLQGECLADFKKTLQQLQILNPDSITIHSLVVKRAADLNIQSEHKNILYDTTDMLEFAEDYLNEYGYQQYYMYRQKNAAGSGMNIQENVGYARNGKEGIYNILTMEEKQSILALGAGGISKFLFPKGEKLVRIENVKNVKDYIERIQDMIMRKEKFLNEQQGFFSI